MPDQTGMGAVPLWAAKAAREWKQPTLAVSATILAALKGTAAKKGEQCHFLYIGPNAIDNPTSSTLNFPLGDDRANAVTVALAGDGTLSVTYAAPVYGPTAHVILDVTGYFTPAG